MEFTKEIKVVDSEGKETMSPTTYKATLSDGLAEIYLVIDDEELAVCTQPWKTNGDGSRSEWVSLEEVVEWFKQRA